MKHDIHRLPVDLRPADGRFGSGPSKVRASALIGLASTGSTYLGTSHRRDGVRSVVHAIRAGLSELYGLPDGFEVLLGNGGATAFWDAASFGLIERRSEHLVFGEFSGKFASLTTAAPHLDDPLVIESPPGTHPAAVADESVDAYALTENETSTGVAMALNRPVGDGLVLVDATSSAGTLPEDAESFDAYYFSPQKAFGSEGGLWLALVSPAGLARIDALRSRWAPASLDLGIALDNSRKDQTYNTPALATLYLLADQITWMIDAGGLEAAAARGSAAASIVYGWADRSEIASPFVTDRSIRSHTIATIDIDDRIDAGQLTAVLRAEGIVDIEAYRKLGRNQVRIAMFPNIDHDDLSRLTLAIEWAAGHLAGA